MPPADDMRVRNLLQADINNTPTLWNIHGGCERGLLLQHATFWKTKS